MRWTPPLFAVALIASAPLFASELVPVPAFRSVELRGGGGIILVPGPRQQVTILEGSRQFTRVYVESDGKLKIDNCIDRCPLAYRSRIRIELPTVPVLAVRGGGSIAAAAGFKRQAELVAAVSGGGQIDVRALPLETATAAVHEGGEIQLRVRQALTAAVSGGGSVRYGGNPQVTTAIRGGGSVRRGD